MTSLRHRIHDDAASGRKFPLPAGSDRSAEFRQPVRGLLIARGGDRSSSMPGTVEVYPSRFSRRTPQGTIFITLTIFPAEAMHFTESKAKHPHLARVGCG